MTILIVTMHRGNNYGSALQVYALSETLKTLGHNPIVLDYIPPRINFKSGVKHALKSLCRIGPIREKYDALRGLMILISSKLLYDSFFRKNINLTKPYYSIDALKKDCPQADIYMTGSDQVWNSFHNKGIEYAFYLDFVPDKATRIAYAASFGKECLDEWEIPETKRLLEQYQAISVRESSAVNILGEMGIPGVVVLDPTFLLSKDEWLKRLPPLKVKEKYLLIYSVEPNKNNLIAYSKLIADKLGLKIYLVEWGLRKYNGVDKMLSLLSPLRLLSYFYNASFVVASSFHGTALSINMNKQFVSIAPSKFNTRVKSLLNLVKLNQRYFDKDTFQIKPALMPIDYTEVNAILSELRYKSMSFLTSAINSNKGK